MVARNWSWKVRRNFSTRLSKASALRRGLCTAKIMAEVPWKVVRACEGECQVKVRIKYGGKIYSKGRG